MSRDSIRARVAAATEGPWRWGGNIDQKEVYLSTVDRGRIFIMRFVRWGMHGAQPTFQNPDPDGWGTVDAKDLAVLERSYRGEIATIEHPDAQFIAHARQDIPALLAVADAVAKAAEWSGTGRARGGSKVRVLYIDDWDAIVAALDALEGMP